VKTGSNIAAVMLTAPATSTARVVVMIESAAGVP
jgi:hypothetical protein